MMLWMIAALLVALLATGSDAAKSFREKAYQLQRNNVSIHVDVNEVGEKKHLVLYYYKGVNREDLVELPPLDVSAFIDHGLATEGDKLTVEYISNTGELVAHFLRASPSPLGNRMVLRGIYNAGGVGYVYLTENSDAPGHLLDDSMAYYVRVPINLFPELDGKALQKKGIDGTFSGYSFTACKTPKSTFDCVLMNFSTSSDAPTQQLATPLRSIWSDYKVNMITTEEIARITVPAVTSTDDTLPYDVSPQLSSDSYLQYLIALSLHSTDFNRMEPKFVQKHGRLPANFVPKRQFVNKKGFLGTTPTGKPTGMVQLVFKKKKVANRVSFPIKECKLGGYYLRTDETETHPDGIGISYTYKLQPDEINKTLNGTGTPSSARATDETKEKSNETATPSSAGATHELD